MCMHQQACHSFVCEAFNRAESSSRQCVFWNVYDSRISEAKGQVQHVILLISDGPQLVVHLLIQDHMTGGTGQGPLTRTWGTHTHTHKLLRHSLFRYYVNIANELRPSEMCYINVKH